MGNQKDPRVTTQHVKATVALSNVNVCESSIRYILKKNDTYGGIARRRSLQLNLKTSSSTVKHGGGRIKVCGCFAVFGPGQIANADGFLIFGLYQQRLQVISCL